jgi:hypothetical protein
VCDLLLAFGQPIIPLMARANPVFNASYTPLSAGSPTATRLFVFLNDLEGAVRPGSIHNHAFQVRITLVHDRSNCILNAARTRFRPRSRAFSTAVRWSLGSEWGAAQLEGHPLRACRGFVVEARDCAISLRCVLMRKNRSSHSLHR